MSKIDQLSRKTLIKNISEAEKIKKQARHIKNTKKIFNFLIILFREKLAKNMGFSI